jgi:hypothetical protein
MLSVKPIVAVAGLVVSGWTVLMTDDALADEIQKSIEAQRNFNAVQRVYQQGVPHTDGKGTPMTGFEAGKSFFPIAMWGAPLPGEYWGEKVDWKLLQEAGVNTVWPWHSADVKAQLKAGNDHGMRIVVMGPIKAEVLKEVQEDPALFGNVWTDEPIGGLGSRDMDKFFQEYTDYRNATHAVAPSLSIFINDAPWIMEPARNWWVRWNTTGEISCHDNYPVMNRKNRSNSIGAEPNGIPQTVGLAVAANQEKKPVWLIVGGFDQPGNYGQAFPFRYASPEQLRACVYAGLIHGATGIAYFVWDTYVPRDGGVLGMAPNPKVAYVPNPQKEGYTKPTPASPIQMIKAKALWEAMTQTNQELKELTPSLLSPTVGSDVAYSLDIVGTAPTETPIRTLLKPHPGGGYVLLSVNVDDAVLKVTYTMPTTIKNAGVLFENRQPEKLSEDSRSFTLTYEPFDAHVVRIER